MNTTTPPRATRPKAMRPLELMLTSERDLEATARIERDSRRLLVTNLRARSRRGRMLTAVIVLLLAALVGATWTMVAGLSI